MANAYDPACNIDRCRCGALKMDHNGKTNTGGCERTGCKGWTRDVRLRAAAQAAAAQIARERLAWAFNLPGVTIEILAEVTGISPFTIRNMLKRQNPSHINASAYTAIMEITEESVDRVRGKLYEPLRSPADALRIARSLAAQGWGYDWQGSQYGTTAKWVRDLCNTGDTSTITPDLAARICETGTLVERAWMRGESIWGVDVECALNALGRGWYPMACYDEETGELVPSAIRTDLKQLIKRSCGKRTAVAA